MKLILVALAMSAAALPCMAQYKCVVGGKTVYADQPCAADARHVGELQDQLTNEQRIQRLEQSIKERRERNVIEGREAAVEEEKQRAAQRYIAAEEEQARAKRQRCDALAREVRSNQRSVAFYQDLAMQRSLTQRERELKANVETYERECRR
jgi:hypothetical protein